MKRGHLLGVLLLIGSLSVAIMGYQGPPAGQGAAPGGAGGGQRGPGGGGGRGGGAPQQLQAIKVRDNLFMLTGAGGNTGVFIQANGVTLVDTKNPNNGQGIMDQVRMLTPKPVTTIINTHTHNDHNGSNEFFTDNVTFVAHENTKTNMDKMTQFAGDKAKFIPSKVYKDTMTLGTGADQIILYYFGRAHTNGDSFVVFPAIRAMHAGDAFANKGFPIVDAANGGSVVEYGKTLARAASTIKNVDTIINGHITTGPNPFADLQVYADFNNDLVAYVQNAIKANKTADQAIAEYTFPQKYVSLGYTAPPPPAPAPPAAAPGAAAPGAGAARGGRGGGGPGNVIRTAYTELGK